MVVGQLNAPDRQPLERRIAQAIVDLQDRIVGGVLTTAIITDRLNVGYPENCCTSSDSVGKICSNRLNLLKPGDTSKRGWKVNQDTIVRLKNTFNLSAGALSALSACVETPLNDGLPHNNQALKAHKALSTYEDTENTLVVESDFYEVP